MPNSNDNDNVPAEDAAHIAEQKEIEEGAKEEVENQNRLDKVYEAAKVLPKV